MKKRLTLGRVGPVAGVLLALGLTGLLSGCRTALPASDGAPKACGMYRWRVKTLSDPQADLVSTEPVEMSIHDLVRLERTRHEPRGARRESELQSYRVRGVLLAVQSRRDHDLHLLLSDPSDPQSRLIAEIPEPACSMGSAYRDDFASAREVAESLRSRPRGETVVEVVGVGFFDVGHIQKGRSHNGLELHPVLSVTEVAPPKA